MVERKVRVTRRDKETGQRWQNREMPVKARERGEREKEEKADEEGEEGR